MSQRSSRRAPFIPPAHCRFAVGHDEHGRWAVYDRLGLVGGLFKDRISAVRFAQRECASSGGAIYSVPDDRVLRLRLIFNGTKPQTAVSRAA